MLTVERIMRLHHFCVQWDSTCSSSRAPLPKHGHLVLSHAGLVLSLGLAVQVSEPDSPGGRDYVQLPGHVPSSGEGDHTPV